MRILIYGSTYLTEITVNLLLQYPEEFSLVGYVPSINPTVFGDVSLPKVGNIFPEYDIGLCLQYDRYIKHWNNTYNVHTGLLPQYGGCDILYHTLKNKEKYQGLTFHKMYKKMDAGPIISRVSYPVLPEDTVISLYKKMSIVFPHFTLGCLRLLKENGTQYYDRCECFTPNLYKRGQIDKKDKEQYLRDLALLRNTFSRS